MDIQFFAFLAVLGLGKLLSGMHKSQGLHIFNNARSGCLNDVVCDGNPPICVLGKVELQWKEDLFISVVKRSSFYLVVSRKTKRETRDKSDIILVTNFLSSPVKPSAVDI